MKKASAHADSDEPMGIVIAMGSRVPVEPLVRAYVWGEWSGADQPSVTGQQPLAVPSGR